MVDRNYKHSPLDTTSYISQHAIVPDNNDISS